MTNHPDRSQTTDRASNPRVNGLAVASLVLGILWLMWIGSILALVFGYIARNQIDRTSDAESGRGMAIAGIVLGWVGVGTLVLMVALLTSGVFTMPDMPMMSRSDIGREFSSNGERIFRTARNNSGEVIGYQEGPGDGMMSGILACADCHGTDGQGGERQMMMETFHAPDIRWSTLEGRYTTETVRSAITQGVASGGRPLNPIMPRWQLSETDLADLIDYLQTFD
jgi:cytochrome c553